MFLSDVTKNDDLVWYRNPETGELHAFVGSKLAINDWLDGRVDPNAKHPGFRSKYPSIPVERHNLYELIAQLEQGKKSPHTDGEKLDEMTKQTQGAGK